MPPERKTSRKYGNIHTERKGERERKTAVSAGRNTSLLLGKDCGRSGEDGIGSVSMLRAKSPSYIQS